MGDSTGIIWPAFLPNQIMVGNPASNVAIVCGWTKRELMKQRLEAADPHIVGRLAGIGQLYTAERGVDMLIRNLLANPRIDTVIFCGSDIFGASKEAEHFLNAGRRLVRRETSSGQEYTATDDDDRVRVWGDIPVELIERVRERVNWIMPLGRIGETVEPELIVGLVNRHHKPKGPNDLIDPPCIYEPPKPAVELYPAPNSMNDRFVTLDSFEKVFVGKCLGIGLVPRGKDDPHVCIQLLVEDDGNWFTVESSFSSYWLPELISITEEAKTWLDQNCTVEKYGWKFKSTGKGADRPRTFCLDCKSVVDPDMCHCGADYKDHHNGHLGHNFVPMGCACGLAKTEQVDEKRSQWDDNTIQFPRLLEELQGAGVIGLLQEKTWKDLEASMDLKREDILDIWDRAGLEFDRIKAELCPKKAGSA